MRLSLRNRILSIWQRLERHENVTVGRFVKKKDLTALKTIKRTPGKSTRWRPFGTDSTVGLTNNNLQLTPVMSQANHQPSSFRGLGATAVHRDILNLLPPPSPSLHGGDLSTPLQHCRETGGCSELTYLMAQECWLAASVPPSILLA